MTRPAGRPAVPPNGERPTDRAGAGPVRPNEVKP